MAPEERKSWEHWSAAADQWQGGWVKREDMPALRVGMPPEKTEH